MALKSLISFDQPEQRLAVYTVTSPAAYCLSTDLHREVLA